MTKLEEAAFGAGCFWHIEEIFRQVKGIVETKVGYSGGKTKKPSYEQVCSGKTSHIETVRIKYDPKIISYQELLDIFWKAHDPTQLDRQGLDVGKQYRSVIFYYSIKQKKLAKDSLKLNQERFKGKIVTKIVKAKTFYEAEDYHQKYILKQSKKSGLFARLFKKK